MCEQGSLPNNLLFLFSGFHFFGAAEWEVAPGNSVPGMALRERASAKPGIVDVS
jgi:hypothetical protein